MNTSSIVFRVADEADIDSIIQLWIESSEYHEGIDSRLALQKDATKHVREYYSKLFKDENSCFAVASTDSILIGYICVQIQE